MRQLYHVARLVHADLSEYNVLVHKGELVVIDVSQSVELDHPRALDFLREGERGGGVRNGGSDWGWAWGLSVWSSHLRSPQPKMQLALGEHWADWVRTRNEEPSIYMLDYRLASRQDEFRLSF